MPHQRLIADVGGEYDPDTGIPYYREIILTVPRQTGKTTLFLTWQIHRCTSPRWVQPQRSAFTAQSGKDARDKWLDELFPLIRRSAKIRRLVASRPGGLAINEGMGNESIRFRTGSLIRLLSTSSSSGHSKTLQQAVLDEIWHDADYRREQGLRPAMITVPDAQLLVCSTAGTELSAVLNAKVATGRAAVESDLDHGVAYFEYSAPDDWDPKDEDSYFAFMPALCPDPPCRCGVNDGGWRHTVTLDVLRAERRAMKPAEYARAYGNRKTEAAELAPRTIPDTLWSPLADARVGRPARVAFALVVERDRSRAWVAYAGVRDDGLMQVGLAQEPRSGTAWVVERLLELREKWNPVGFAVSTRSEALLLDLEKAGFTVPDDPDQPKRGDLAVMTAAQDAAAFGAFVDAARNERLRHSDDPQVSAGVALDATRSSSGGLAWDEKVPEMAPLRAVCHALWLFESWAHLVADDYDAVGQIF